MNRFVYFIQKERLYVLLLVFVLLFNVVMLVNPLKNTKHKSEKSKTATTEISSRKAEFEEAVRKNERLTLLFGTAALLILAVLLLGIVLDIIIAAAMLSGKFNIRTLGPPAVKWTVWDVCKVVILFLFFGYIIIISEAFWSRLFPVLKSNNIRMIINTSMLDGLSIFFVIYFTVTQYKEGLKALGLSMKNFFKNVFYGVAGYVALVPVLVLILVITAAIIKVTKYVPSRQPVVELFLKEKNAAFLTYSSLFAAVFGPVIEELFFRGFMYSAFKKYIGSSWAMVVTAAIFAGLHTHPVGLAPIMALGILLAYLYEKTGTLVAPITVHIIHNLSMVFFVFLIKQVGVI